MTLPHATGAERSSFDELKILLLAEERERLAALENSYKTLADRIGDAPAFTASVADVLADALKKAEVDNHRRLASAIAPLVISAIRREISASRDMMVEALYPIAGRMVTTAVSHAFSDLVAQINERIERVLSVRLWKYRLRSLVTGKPVSELVLADSLGARLETLLLLDRHSGAVLARYPATAGDEQQDALIGGLLTAISDLGRSAFKDGQADLRTLDFNGRKVLLRASGAHILVSVYQGLVSPHVEAGVDAAFIGAVDRLVSDDAAPPEAILASTAETLTSLGEGDAPKPSKRGARIVGFVLIAALLAAGGWWLNRAVTRHRLDAALAAVSHAPRFAPLPLTIMADHVSGKVIVNGVMPDADTAEALRQAVAAAAPAYDIEQRIAITDRGAESRMQDGFATEMSALRRDIAALHAALATRPDQAMLDRTLAEANAVAAASGRTMADALANQTQELRQRLASAEASLATLAQNLETAQSRIPPPPDPLAQFKSFAEGTAIVFTNEANPANEAQATRIISELAGHMRRLPAARLMIFGHADMVGSEAANRTIALSRAEFVATRLAQAGIATDRLVAAAAPRLGLTAAQTGPGSLGRRVEFRVLSTEVPVP